jgi:hypothetical protein
MSIGCATWVHSYLQIHLQFGDVLEGFFIDHHAAEEKLNHPTI